MKKQLVYKIVPHNGEVVFATPERAASIDRINRAMREAKTWAEFRKLMPAKAYSEIIQNYDDEGEKRPRGSDPFRPEQIGGFCDGDYPPWLQKEMDQVLPPSFFKKYATRSLTAINGWYWSISSKALKDALPAMRERGWEISEASDLDFH